MKGISHFTVGVAVASCFPAAVRAAVEGHALHFVLGGVFGLLPDTLDFKLSRFLYRHDMEVAPDPLRKDPRMIAEAVAHAVRSAYAQGRTVRLKLSTIRLGADAWQSYEVRFDTRRRAVHVSYGPAVDTGGNPIEGPDAVPAPSAKAAVPCDLRLDYRATTRVDIFDGPVFAMEPAADGSVTPRFLPWHRSWSHSLPLAFLAGLAAAAVWDITAGAVVAAAAAAHGLLDQLGFMGSNLWFPFGKNRTGGLKRFHSGEALPNLAAVWSACLLIFWNLYRQLPEPVPLLNPIRYVFWGLAAPAAGVLAGRRILACRRPTGAAGRRKQRATGHKPA